MSSSSPQTYEKVPEEVLAIQWDGSKESTTAIRLFLSGFHILDEFVYQESIDSNGHVIPQVRFTVTSHFSDFFEEIVELSDWVVMHESGMVQVMEDKDFRESYRANKPTITNH